MTESSVTDNVGGVPVCQRLCPVLAVHGRRYVGTMLPHLREHDVVSVAGFGQFHDESEVGYWTGMLGECTNTSPLVSSCSVVHTGTFCECGLL